MSWTYANNTLIVTYTKPNAVLLAVSSRHAPFPGLPIDTHCAATSHSHPVLTNYMACAWRRAQERQDAESVSKVTAKEEGDVDCKQQ